MPRRDGRSAGEARDGCNHETRQACGEASSGRRGERRYLWFSQGQSEDRRGCCFARTNSGGVGRSLLILLDTHVVACLVSEPERLSKNAKAAIDDARQHGDGLAVSGITLVEITTLYGRRRILLAMSLESFLGELERKFVVLPINARTCARMLSFPAGYPK